MGRSDAELREWADKQSLDGLAHLIENSFADALKATSPDNHKDFIERRRPIYIAAQARKRLGVDK